MQKLGSRSATLITMAMTLIILMGVGRVLAQQTSPRDDGFPPNGGTEDIILQTLTLTTQNVNKICETISEVNTIIAQQIGVMFPLPPFCGPPPVRSYDCSDPIICTCDGLSDCIDLAIDGKCADDPDWECTPGLHCACVKKEFSTF